MDKIIRLLEDDIIEIKARMDTLHSLGGEETWEYIGFQDALSYCEKYLKLVQELIEGEEE